MLKLLSAAVIASAVNVAFANESAYVVLDAGRSGNEPYRWMLAEGTVLKTGTSDAAGRAFLVSVPGRTDYVLEMLWGRFKVNVPAECWNRTPKDFESCAHWSPREDTEEQKEKEAAKGRKLRAAEANSNRRAAWVARELTPTQQAAILGSVFTEHREWMKLPEAKLDATDFSCRTLALPSSDPEANRWFEQGKSLPFGQEQDFAFAKAAGLGHWRAAARLVGLSLEDEDWESAEPIVAWLLGRKIPAGYNKLADLLAARGSYEDGMLDDDLRVFLTTLRWRAAQLGDPVAQSQMSRHFQDAGHRQLADTLLQCARQQNPEIR
jgi:hypothetical protein